MKDEGILESILQSLLRDFNRIENRLILNEDNDEKLAKYVNAKQRTSKSILYCISPALKNCVVRKTRTMIKFSNRSVIHALPCGPNGDTIRSKTANLLIVDEANYVPESVITEVALPMLATTNRMLILISSPTNKNHYFYRALNSPTWSKYHFKTEDNPTITKEYLAQAEEIESETAFRREFLDEFVDEENTYFAMPLL